MGPTVLLWDIDGTLVDTAGAGARAMLRAFAEITGSSLSARFSYAGMTDTAIVRRGLVDAGLVDDEANTSRVLDRYLELLAGELSTTEGIKVLPGVRTILSAARDRHRMAVGLGTGNVRRGAELKLRRTSLWNEFSFGGFGCDDERRPALIRLGADRGAEKLGVDRAQCRVIVIGDTPLDVDAARACGAECVAVATGSYSVEALREAGATLAVLHLDEPRAIEAIVG